MNWKRVLQTIVEKNKLGRLIKEDLLDSNESSFRFRPSKRTDWFCKMIAALREYNCVSIVKIDYNKKFVEFLYEQSRVCVEGREFNKLCRVTVSDVQLGGSYA